MSPRSKREYTETIHLRYKNATHQEKTIIHGNRRYIVPSLSIIRDVLIRVDPVYLDCALQRWNQAYGQQDESLAKALSTMSGDL